MNPLLAHLMEEHRWIEKLLDLLELTARQIDAGNQVPTAAIKNLLDSLSELVEHKHHDAEEKILFPILLEAGITQQGGPRCGFFFDYVITGNPTQKIFDVLPADFTPQFSEDHLRLSDAIQAAGSPLDIPMAEHEAGHSAVSWMKKNVPEMSDSSDLRNSFSEIARLYVSLLRLHIRKEDECLFVLADQLPAPLQKKMSAATPQVTLRDWQELDRTIATLKEVLLPLSS